jgi:hypothetical protein
MALMPDENFLEMEENIQGIDNERPVPIRKKC